MLNTGVIIRGNLVLSLAGVDLVYLGLDLIVTSVETALRNMAELVRPNAAARRRRSGDGAPEDRARLLRGRTTKRNRYST